MLITTSTLSAGLDYASVYLVLLIDTLSGLVDYTQKTGQKGCDGQLTEYIIFLALSW